MGRNLYNAFSAIHLAVIRLPINSKLNEDVFDIKCECARDQPFYESQNLSDYKHQQKTSITQKMFLQIIKVENLVEQSINLFPKWKYFSNNSERNPGKRFFRYCDNRSVKSPRAGKCYTSVKGLWVIKSL